MIRPVRFAGNPQTSAPIAFSSMPSGAPDEVQAAALREFDALVDAARGRRQRACLRRHARAAYAGFHLSQQLGELPCRRHGRAVSDAGRESAAGTAAGSARSAEREHGFHVAQRDRPDVTRAAAAVSRRHRQPGARSRASHCLRLRFPAHRSGRAGRLRAAARLRDRRLRSLDAAARPIYHTNVLMSVGARFAAICSRAFAKTSAPRCSTRCARPVTRSWISPWSSSQRSPATCWSCARRAGELSLRCRRERAMSLTAQQRRIAGS